MVTMLQKVRRLRQRKTDLSIGTALM